MQPPLEKLANHGVLVVESGTKLGKRSHRAEASFLAKGNGARFWCQLLRHRLLIGLWTGGVNRVGSIRGVTLHEALVVIPTMYRSGHHGVAFVVVAVIRAANYRL